MGILIDYISLVNRANEIHRKTIQMDHYYLPLPEWWDMNLVKKENRLYNGNMVAIIVSPGYGAGWSSWSKRNEELVFDADIAEAILQKEYERAIVLAEEKYPDACTHGIEQCVVQWLRKGTVFQIHVTDGYERIEEMILPENHYVA
jgi:hypothetical protein